MESINLSDNTKSGISDLSIKINNKFADFEDSTLINSLKIQNSNCDEYVNDLLKNEEAQFQINLPLNMMILKDSKKILHAPRKINNKRAFHSNTNEIKNEIKQENSLMIEPKSMILYHELQESESTEMTESIQFDEKEQIKTENERGATFEKENTLFNSNFELPNKNLKNQTETQPIEIQSLSANEPYSIDERSTIQLETAVTELNATTEKQFPEELKLEKVTNEPSSKEEQFSIQLNAIETEVNETQESEKVTNESNITIEKQFPEELKSVEIEMNETQESEKVTNEQSSKEEQLSIQLNTIETEMNETQELSKVTNESNIAIEKQFPEELKSVETEMNETQELSKVANESTQHKEHTEPTENISISNQVEYVNADTDASSKIIQSHSVVVESNKSDDSNSKQQISQSFSMPQPPKIVPPSVRYKRYKQLANRRNIATSPISTLNLEELEAESKQKQEQHEPKEPTNPQKSKKKRKTKTQNFLKRTESTKQQNERLPTPPQIHHHHTQISKINQKRTSHISRSESNRCNSKRPFEIPSPQVVLDIEAVRNQFGRGKIELLPLVKRIENDKINTHYSMNSILRNNSNDLINNIEICNKKHIFLPNSNKFTGNQTSRNQSARRNIHEQTAKISRRRLNHYENSELTPRQHIPNFNKRHSSVENCQK